MFLVTLLEDEPVETFILDFIGAARFQIPIKMLLEKVTNRLYFRKKQGDLSQGLHEKTSKRSLGVR